MNYKSFNLGDWIGHINGVIEDESELDGDEMRDLVEFLTTLKQEPCDKCVYSTSEGCQYDDITETIPPFGDCISRQAVEKITWEEPSYTDALNVLTEVRDKVKALPPVNPQKPKTGHWIPSHIPESILDECSECGFSCGAFTFNYCPNCGAKMG